MPAPPSADFGDLVAAGAAKAIAAVRRRVRALKKHSERALARWLRRLEVVEAPGAGRGGRRSDSIVGRGLPSLRRDCFVKTPRLPPRGDSATKNRCRDCFNWIAKPAAGASSLRPMTSQSIMKSYPLCTKASGPFCFEQTQVSTAAKNGCACISSNDRRAWAS